MLDPISRIQALRSAGNAPLLARETSEWGDPAFNTSLYDNIISYTPAVNLVSGVSYPYTLITQGPFPQEEELAERAQYIAAVRLSPLCLARPAIVRIHSEAGSLAPTHASACV